jgi:hypothetical protein
MTSISDKKVFTNCTDDHYQRDILKYVSIEEKELRGILKMVTIAPRSGGNFRSLIILNKETILVKEL